jgi:hypothetical protein
VEAFLCPNCGKSTCIPGRVVAPEYYAVDAFAAAHTQSFVRFRVPFHACMSCGHCSASVDPEELRRAIARSGTELVREHVKLLDLGPYFDLPDIAEARKAADQVMEIDTLVLAGRVVEAKRRFLELTGQSWDDVLVVMSKWADLKRPRKLALLGWRPKHEIDDDKVATRDHPMHDHVLDG